MNLIIKDKIPMFIEGYPTVSDKYDVVGGILEGTSDAQFGQLVKNGTTAGYFKPINATDTISAVTEIVGLILATNVQLASGFPGTEVKVEPGEAFNLFIRGFVAVKLDVGAVVGDVTANAPVYVTTAGKFTTATATEKIATPVPGVVYTGMHETHEGGTDLFAEIYVR